MKFVKGISLFVLYPVIMLSIGFVGGVMFLTYFYPGVFDNNQKIYAGEEIQNTPDTIPYHMTQEQEAVSAGEENNGDSASFGESGQTTENLQGHEAGESTDSSEDELLEVAALSDRITVDTVYILEETDIRNQTVVETTGKAPDKYIGMNREQFLEAMSEYENVPPLTEKERGFVDLNVVSFSGDRVVVQMNYKYTQPSSSFYLMVRDNYVIVYLDDKETVYMYTDILLTELPDKVQQDIINTMFIPDEESLYGFLETYSS